MLGIKLRPASGSRTNSTPSLDRIIPKKGYVRGNIIVISWRANLLKRDATIKELMQLASFYSRFNRKEQLAKTLTHRR